MQVDSTKANHFSASTFHLDQIAAALNCLMVFENKQDVLIFIDEDGLSFARESNHTIKIQVFLSRDLFASYSYQNEFNNQNKLCVNINYLLNSFNVAHRNIDDALESTISYNGPGTPLELIFEDSLVSERVEYLTYHVSNFDTIGLELDRDQILFECIIKGDVLYSAVKELKDIGCRECCIFAKVDDDDEPTFALLSKSQLGFSRIKLPSSRSILEKLQVYDGDSTSVIYNKPVLGVFDSNSFDKIRQSTKVASKVLLRMDIHGLLSVNILSRTDDIVLTDKRSNGNNNGNNGNKSKLFGEYPGLVIEICMLEKENINEADQQEFCLLMDIDELDNTSRISKRVSHKRQKMMSKDNGHANVIAPSNLLGLSNATTEPLRLQAEYEGHSQSPSNNNNEITLFF